jgi:hypothetical protein
LQVFQSKRHSSSGTPANSSGPLRQTELHTRRCRIA